MCHFIAAREREHIAPLLILFELGLTVCFVVFPRPIISFFELHTRWSLYLIRQISFRKCGKKERTVSAK